MSATNFAKYPVTHQQYVKQLYRRSLKLSLDWYGFRNIWRQKALEIRERFEANRSVTSSYELKRILEEAEEELEHYRHPEPYKFPTAPGGSKYERNLPPPIVPYIKKFIIH
ncbi:5075_t:CDS:2 [Ambispora leptoticha]|uniref:NADH dehydrogenase [ubiquinone] 1 beta subcomplex subunit 9 n=1 Tax=Ambispora leptoticha TaxID=144679 RepID=A0A9N8YQL1_9GLOM|nr:5075_t:CDS:2 [Ambispora leptoticha]